MCRIADGREVARLQNSIIHLQETQLELRSYLEEESEDGDEDGEIGLAISENETTMYVSPYLIPPSPPSSHTNLHPYCP